MKPTVVSLTIFAGLWLFAGCTKESHPPEPKTLPPISVPIQIVKKRATHLSETVVGTVSARYRATIAAKATGRIRELPVQLGDKVNAGQTLARLDLQEMDARLEQASAVLEQRERDLVRFTALLDNQAVTQAEFDRVKADHRVAKGALEEARTLAGYAHIKAPFDGVIARKLAEPGDLAVPGKPLLELENPKALRLEADVPATLVSYLAEGQTMQIEVPSARQTIEGRLKEISPAADPSSRTFLVKVDLPETSLLRSGQFGRLMVPTEKRSILTVPSESVVRRGQMELIFVEEDGAAKLRLIKTGKRVGNQIEVISGLTEGERIVVAGGETLRDRQPIKAAP